MHNETFYLDGVDAKEVGIRLQKAIEFAAASPVVENKTVPGRNGDLLIYTGAYKNRKGEAECFALKENVISSIGEINNFLFSQLGYRRLECSNDPDHFWLAKVTNSARIEQRMRMLAPFEITFDCKPQRFLISGETPFEYLEPSFIINPTQFPAKPVIVVYGTGAGNLVVGGTVVQIKELEDEIILDCEMMNAYRQVGEGAPENKNSCIYAPEFPELLPGENIVSWDGGITSVKITPRWWTL